MTQEELDKIVEQHRHWLHEDVDGWEGMRADLTGANLYGADKVIADKDKQLRRHKYRRCLDMAYKCAVLCQKSKDLYRWAEDENLEHHYNHKIEFFARWHNRWMELAEKFKPNNSTAQ